MPSIHNQGRRSQPSLLVYMKISGMLAIEYLLLSPGLNCGEVERMQKTQASSLNTGQLTKREGLPVHAHARTHTYTHTHCFTGYKCGLHQTNRLTSKS